MALKPCYLHERGLIAAEWGQPLHALADFKAALEAWDTGAREHPGLVNMLLELANAYNVTGHPREAEATVRRAQTSAARMVNNNHPIHTMLSIAQTILSRSKDGAKSPTDAAIMASLPAQTALIAVQTTASDDVKASLKQLQHLTQKIADQAPKSGTAALSTARVLLTLGRASAQLGDFRAAATTTTHAETLLSTANLLSHPLHLQAQVARAVYLHRHGDPQAPALLDTALTAARDGPGSTALADAISASANTLHSDGQYTEANERWTKALTLTKELVGEASPRYAFLLLAQGRAQLAMGQLHAGQERLMSALRIAQKALSNRHSDMLPFITGVARGYLAAGKHREAASVLRTGRKTVARNQLMGPTAADWALVNAQMHLTSGKYPEAQKHLNAAQARLAHWPVSNETERLIIQIQQIQADLLMRTGAIDRALAALAADAPKDNQARADWALAKATMLDTIGQSVEALAVLERYQGEADDRLLTRKALITAGIGSLGDAIAIQRESVQLASTRSSNTHPRTLSAKLVLLGLLRRAGQWDDASAMYDGLATALATRFGNEHPSLIELGLERALLAQAQTRYGQAAERFAQTQTLAEKYLSISDPTLVTLIIHRAAALNEAGQASDAQNLLTRASNNLQRSVGETHPLYANTQLALGRTAMAIGDTETAASALRAAEPAIQILPAKHPLRAKAVLAQARLALATDDHRFTQQLLSQAIQQEQITNAADTLQAVSLQTLAAVRAGNISQAQYLMADALKIFDTRLERSRSHLPPLTLIQAKVLEADARDTDAQAILRDAIDKFDTENTHQLTLNLALAAVLSRSGRPLEALDLIKETMPIVQNRLSANHPLMAFAQLTHGAALLVAGRLEQSEAALELAQQALERRVTNQHPLLLDTLMELAEVHRLRGNASTGAQLLQRALTRLTKATVTKSQANSMSIPVSKLQVALAKLRRAQGKLAEAQKYYAASKQMLMSTDAAESPDPALALQATAGLAQINHGPEAKQHANAVLATDETHALTIRAVITAHNTLSRAALQAGQLDQATTQFSAARDRIAKLYSVDHPLAAQQLRDEARDLAELWCGLAGPGSWRTGPRRSTATVWR